jgi:NAD(P)H dehydrogenase (quinone)
VDLPAAEYRDVLVKAGLPEAIAALLEDTDTSVSKGALFDDGHQLSKLIGRPTTSLATAVAAAMGSAKGGL